MGNFNLEMGFFNKLKKAIRCNKISSNDDLIAILPQEFMNDLDKDIVYRDKNIGKFFYKGVECIFSANVKEVLITKRLKCEL